MRRIPLNIASLAALLVPSMPEEPKPPPVLVVEPLLSRPFPLPMFDLPPTLYPTAEKISGLAQDLQAYQEVLTPRATRIAPEMLAAISELQETRKPTEPTRWTHPRPRSQAKRRRLNRGRRK